MMLFEPLYNSLFRQSANGETADLDKIVEDYPYFSAAHFFRLQQAIRNGVPDPSVIAKTALHFNNPLLLNYQLNRRSISEFGDNAVTTQSVKEMENESHADNESTAGNADNLPLQLETVNEIKSEGAGHAAEFSGNVPPDEIPEADAESATPLMVDKHVNEEELLFEPLHTSDYFASQGIKMSEEVQPTDKLGIQLKSFTQWLKTMKKVHEAKLPEGSEQLDASVNRLAEKSNLETEVVTEAMADAFLLQGKPLKAKDIYLKLSLLNPSKNAYFAAKLEQIK